MPILRCPSCGHENPPQARFCDQCSTALPRPADPPPLRLPTVRGRVISIGRAPDNDVVLDYPMISSRQARVTIDGSEAFIEDLGSTNGTAIGSPAHKISRSPLQRDDTVYFGSFPIPASRLLRGSLSLGKGAHKTVEFRGNTLVLGRDPAADVVLEYPMVSWRHARLERSGGQVTVEDLGSTNGTFVNGRRISGSVPIGAGDTIGLGSYVFQLTGLDRLEQRDYRGNVTIEARGVRVDVPGRRLVESTSLTIYPSELVALMGPSGAGKTTLMNTLNGYVRPSAGTVLFNGEDLYAHYDQFRMHIGYVPQDDIIHRDLTVREALYYTARLRLPKDMSDAEIGQRIQSVLEKLNLTDAANTPVGSPEKKGISGGQRKRVNLAMELLTDPFVLFLDEPTSGLSSKDALMVVDLLRKLADEGKTILLTIHQPSREVFRKMDSVAVVSKDPRTAQPGQLVYFGPAYPDSVRFLNPEAAKDAEPSPDVLLDKVEGRTPEFAASYAASPYKSRYVDERAGTNPALRAEPSGKPVVRRDTGLLQWLTLVRRGFILKVRDVWNTAILLTQAPIIAVLLVWVFRREIKGQDWMDASAGSAKVLFLMVIAAIWFGCSNSARDIVGEWAIYHRERMINLKIPSYVGSKLVVLGTSCFIQCVVLWGVVYWGCDLQGEPLLLFGLLLLTSWIGVAVGLVISAVSRTSEVAISLVPLVLLPMVILGGMMQPVHKMDNLLQSVTALMPSRWAFEGLLVMESDNFRPKPTPTPTPASPPAVPVASPGPTAAAANGNAPKDICMPPGDMAESYFQEENRSSVARVAAVAAFMFVILTWSCALILRLRDVH